MQEGQEGKYLSGGRVDRPRGIETNYGREARIDGRKVIFCITLRAIKWAKAMIVGRIVCFVFLFMCTYLS